jgi:hypothetical protein
MPDMKDVTMSATDLAFTPAHPVMGDSVVLTMIAHNTGIVQTGSFNLALYEGDPAAGGVLLQTFPIANLSGDGSATLTYTFTAEPKTYQFTALADTENVVAEMYEDNNTAIRALKIKAQGETSGPDNMQTMPDFTNMLFTSQTVTISAHVKAAFQNIDDAKMADSSSVLIFDDKNGDGTYTQGLDALIGKGAYTAAKLNDEPMPEFVLLIMRAYSPALYIEGSVYLVEHDGKINWGPVYLRQLASEISRASYERATVTADGDKDAEPVIRIRANDKDMILDKDGYLKQPQSGPRR